MRHIREDLVREYGRTPRGVKVEDTKCGKSLHHVTVVAAVIHGNGGTKQVMPECYRGSMKGERFEQWMKEHMLTQIERGKTVIMDNARFHRQKELEKTCNAAGVNILYLPSYSPDYKAIEKNCSSMKRE